MHWVCSNSWQLHRRIASHPHKVLDLVFFVMFFILWCLMFCFCFGVAALQSLANLQSQAGLSLAASNSQQTGAPDLNNLNAASIPGLAALANFTTNSSE